ncbi:retropepsin-like aspartic protease family protein [Novosphingobium beihaiensis]|uniref:Retroviral-like aspartic protease family protein n=1 Tax=Novosphingobium beihaiensis TaxID=2930389 RepID=A0ABT0BUR5_9SPHN|nr:retropepsin-like aspartic protease [Novosphingobium beihaiensis]MCJ2188752.1 retroviral-like aspartic protease family protein [Novosphingobium beihaiensis]
MGPLILLIAAAAGIGWFAPDLTVSPQTAPKPAEAAPGSGQAGTRAAAAAVADETVLSRQSDGHFYARADINAHSTRFLIDTGASMIALTGADAQAIGLHWDPSELRPVGQGASGIVYGVPVRLEHVELGAYGARGVSAVIVPKGLGVSLLGQSFLARIPSVSIAGDRMTLGGG